MNFTYVTTINDYTDACKTLYSSPRLAVDTETYVLPEWSLKGGSALDPHTGSISLVIIKNDSLPPFIFDLLHLKALDYDSSLLIDTLESVKLYQLGINYKFDIKFFMSTFNYLPTKVRCLMVMDYMLTNATGSKIGNSRGHSYADLCREYLDVHITGKDTLRLSDWGIPLHYRSLSNPNWLSKLEYAANDVSYLFPIHDILEETIRTPLPTYPITQPFGLGMESVLQTECSVIPIVAQMEYNGIEVCKTTLQQYQELVENKIKELSVSISTKLNLCTLQVNWEGSLVVPDKIMKVFRSSSGLLDILQKAIKLEKLPDVQSSTLTRLFNIIDSLFNRASITESGDGHSTPVDDIFINEEESLIYNSLIEQESSFLLESSSLIKDILTLKQLLKQQGMNLEKYINPKTGRIHSSFHQNCASTGRFTSTSPNSQQISNICHVLLTLNKPWLSLTLE